jgi:RES domain-containing protein
MVTSETEPDRRWIGSVYRLVPHGADVLDFSHADKNPNNRWNFAGSRTLYLAEDVDIAWNEYTRHVRDRMSPGMPLRIVERDMYRLRLRLDGGVVDLCDSSVSERYGVDDMWHPVHFGSLDTTRLLADRIRRATPAQGILVPPAGFLDRRMGWNLVVFLEKMPKIEDWLLSTTLIHSFDMGTGRH